MDITALPFDADEMLAGLRPWVECESPTWDAAAVNRMMDLAAHDLAVMGARVERIPGRMGLGDSVRARFPHPEARAEAPGILVLGHLDTVHPIGTLEALPFRREGDLCYGPGICDMKGGNYLALEAMRQLARAGIATKLPVTVLLTPDEEIGTPSARALIEAEAARARAVLVPEPGGWWRRAATPSRASASLPSAGRATPARGSPRAARRSARCAGASSRSRR